VDHLLSFASPFGDASFSDAFRSALEAGQVLGLDAVGPAVAEVAIHRGLPVLDRDDVVLGLGRFPGGSVDAPAFLRRGCDQHGISLTSL
jgi:hypothetical protein